MTRPIDGIPPSASTDTADLKVFRIKGSIQPEAFVKFD